MDSWGNFSPGEMGLSTADRGETVAREGRSRYNKRHLMKKRLRQFLPQ